MHEHQFIEEEIKDSRRVENDACDADQVRLDLEPCAPRLRQASGFQRSSDAPHAGHTAMIADYHNGQSLIETLLATVSTMWH